MGSSRIAFAALGIACVAAAAGGSYVATRHNIADRTAPALAAVSGPVAPVPTATSQGVGSSTSERADVAPATAPHATVVAPAEPKSSSKVAQARAGNVQASKTPHTQPSAPQVARVDAPAPASVERQAPAASVSTPAAVAEPASVARADERSVEPQRAPEPPEPAFDEVTVAADAVIGLRTDTTLSSERARVEDKVEARVVRDVRAGSRVAIPAGTRVLGTVVVVERGGKMRDRARLGIRFNTLLLADGTRMPISTETIYRYGDAPGNDSAKKIGGGAVAGAILGAIIGGGKGAAIGATTGAAGGSAMVMAGERSEAVFPSGADVTARILAPVTIVLER